MNLENIHNFLNLDLKLVTSTLWLVATSLVLIKLLQKLERWLLVVRKRPPGPFGLPLVGYLPFLGKEPNKTLWKMRGKYGNIIGVNLGPKYTVVLNDYYSMKEVMCHPAALNRAPGIFAGIDAKGIMTGNGKIWEDQRKYVISKIQHLAFGGEGGWVDSILEEIHTFTEKLKELNGKPTDISPILNHSLISNVVVLLMGPRLKDDDEMKLCIEFLDNAFVSTSSSNATTVVPGLRRLCEIFKIAGYDRYSKVNRKFSELIIEKINLHKTASEYKKESDFINSYLETLSELSESKNKKHYFSETELHGHLIGLFLGATDNIFSSLMWLFRLMCQHKDVQDKVYKELMKVIGKDGRVDYDERDKIPYTYAVIIEGQRHGSVMHFNTTRIASRDIPVQEYVIPKGTEIIANMWAIHHDPDYWDKPDEFRPERFLSVDGMQLIKPTINFVPFSVGKRNCPGEKIAWMEMLHYFAETVKNFEISTPPGVKPEFETVNGLVVHLVPQALCFIERKN